MISVGMVKPKVGKVAEVKKNYFLVELFPEYLKGMSFEIMGRDFKLIDGKWFLRFPCEAFYCRGFNHEQ